MLGNLQTEQRNIATIRCDILGAEQPNSLLEKQLIANLNVSTTCKKTLSCSTQFTQELFVRRPALQQRLANSIIIMKAYIRNTLLQWDGEIAPFVYATYALYWTLRLLKIFEQAVKLAHDVPAIVALKKRVYNSRERSEQSDAIDAAQKFLESSCSKSNIDAATALIYDGESDPTTGELALACLCTVLPYFKWRDAGTATIDIRLLFNMLTENRMVIQLGESYVIFNRHTDFCAAAVLSDECPPNLLKPLAIPGVSEQCVALTLGTVLNIVAFLQQTAHQETARLA